MQPSNLKLANTNNAEGQLAVCVSQFTTPEKESVGKSAALAVDPFQLLNTLLLLKSYVRKLLINNEYSLSRLPGAA